MYRASPRKVIRAAVVVARFARTRGMCQQVFTCIRYVPISVPRNPFRWVGFQNGALKQR